MYKRVLLKLSGEAIGDSKSPYSVETLDNLAKQIKGLAKKGVEIGIVVGGGNICRGRTFEKLGIERKRADYIGMCATVMNAQMLSAALTNNKVNNIVFTKYPVKNVIDYDVNKAKRYLKKGYVCIFGGGTGLPFYSTDTACAQRARDIEAEVILFAKNGVDGVYTADPAVDSNAKRIEKMSFNDIIKNNLQVIDLDAAKICKKHNIKGFVFNMAEKDAIKKSAEKKIVGTTIE